MQADALATPSLRAIVCSVDIVTAGACAYYFGIVRPATLVEWLGPVFASLSAAAWIVALSQARRRDSIVQASMPVFIAFAAAIGWSTVSARSGMDDRLRVTVTVVCSIVATVFMGVAYVVQRSWRPGRFLHAPDVFVSTALIGATSVAAHDLVRLVSLAAPQRSAQLSHLELVALTTLPSSTLALVLGAGRGDVAAAFGACYVAVLQADHFAGVAALFVDVTAVAATIALRL